MSGRFGVIALDQSGEHDWLGNKSLTKGQLSTINGQREREASNERKQKEAPTAGRWGGRMSEKEWGGEPEKEAKIKFNSAGYVLPFAKGGLEEMDERHKERLERKEMEGRTRSTEARDAVPQGRWGGRASDKAGLATDPPVSEAQRKAMFAAKSGHSNLGIPKSVGEEFANADPGGHLPEHK